MQKGVLMLFRLFALILLGGLGCSSAQADPDGARLYASNCAACHGETGTGGIGVPLALPSFQASVSDAYLRKTIHLGRPGRVMPAFSRLKEDEIDAIVGHLRSWSSGPTVTYSDKPVPGDPEHGKQLFQKHCAACHGANGEGANGTGGKARRWFPSSSRGSRKRISTTSSATCAASRSNLLRARRRFWKWRRR